VIKPSPKVEHQISIPSSILGDEKEASRQRKKRRRLIFMARKVRDTAPGGTFLTGCNIADEKVKEEYPVPVPQEEERTLQMMIEDIDTMKQQSRQGFDDLAEI